MRALLDATAIPAQRVGVGHYVVGLVRALGAREDLTLDVLASPSHTLDLAAGSRVRIHPVSHRTRPQRLVWEQTRLPVRVRKLAPDVFHGPHYTLPPSLRCPAVVTFHDPTFYTMPEVHERAKVTYFRRMAKLGVRRAARVIAVSEYARRGAVEHAGAEPDAVDVVRLGVDPSVYHVRGNETVDARLRARVGVDGPYLFWVGAVEPRKDVPSLVEAFAALAGDGAPHTLVLAGPPAWGATAVDAAVERSGLASRIVRPGYVSEDEKIALLRGADAFVYPSLAEGFGIQVVEAMACGCPVVTTSGSAPAEVGGDAVEIVPPGAPAALRQAIERVVSDPARAAVMRQRGLERAAGFTWQATAAATADVYRRAAGG